MKRWNVDKMIEDGGYEFSSNGNARVGIVGLSQEASATYDRKTDKIITFDLTDEDQKRIEERYRN